MKQERLSPPDLIGRVAEYGAAFRKAKRPLHPSATTSELRQAFCVSLPEDPTCADAVIDHLIAAAEPGLVGNTDPNFFAWVMGGSDLAGVAADVLTSVWGQNAAIYQTAPAAAIAEEAVASWVLDLLDLPRACSVGLVTGATMAGFVGLAAARSEVLRRAGHDFERYGLQGAPFVRIYLSDDAHVCNETVLRYLGFGEANLVRIASDDQGLMRVEELKRALVRTVGPKIIIGQAGHINSGGFEDFEALSKLSKAYNAWLHVDGAFALWARVLPEKSSLTRGLEHADSWSVDGHKWMQLPYDSGFAIVRNTKAHRRAMDIRAGYLNTAQQDGRNPTEFNPELSRRARGFAAWATFMSLGRRGVRDLVAGHCNSTSNLADKISDIAGLEVAAMPVLNQITLRTADPNADDLIVFLAEELNRSHAVFVKTAVWKGRTVLRLSVITQGTNAGHCTRLADAINTAWEKIQDMTRYSQGHHGVKDGY